MIYLKDENVSALFLNHQEIVKRAYNKYDNLQAAVYTLKTGLFNYKIRNDEKTSSKRKKRRKPESDPCEREEEIKKLQTVATTITNLLKEKRIYPNLNSEQNYFQFSNKIFYDQNFPKFKGENNTKTPILFETNSKKYLIPPQSKFFNYDIRGIGSIEPPLGQFDFIVIDPPWKNRYVRRIKKVKREYGYDMFENDMFAEIPIKDLIRMNSIVVTWCTNSPSHQEAVIKKLLPSWNLKLLKKLYWIKLNRNGDIVCEFHDPGQKQPYEVLFVAAHKDFQESDSFLNDIDFIVSSSSVIHSHKPPLLEIFQKYLPENSKCLELFARCLYPNFTSIGLEVIKLMDIRLYDCTERIK